MSDKELEKLQRDTFGYFLKERNPGNGLVADNTWEDAPCSVTAVGLALACYAVGAERGFITRAEAVQNTLTTLRFFHDSPQNEELNATGYKGFYYHFLDMETGRPTWNSELSTIDTTFLLAGALTAASYFDREAKGEREIRKLADALYRRVDLRWAQNGGLTVSHAWKPGRGFQRHRWDLPVRGKMPSARNERAGIRSDRSIWPTLYDGRLLLTFYVMAHTCRSVFFSIFEWRQ